MAEIDQIKTELITRVAEASQVLQDGETSANKVVAELVEEFAFALGPAAYSAKSHADRIELAGLVRLADLVLDVAALTARADSQAKRHLIGAGKVGVVGMLTALGEHRARGHIAQLLVADVAAMLYRAQGWVGAVMGAEQAGHEIWLEAYRDTAQEVPAKHEREENAIAWISGFSPRLERKRRVTRLKQLARDVRGRSGFLGQGWKRWKPTHETLATALAQGIRSA